MTEMAVTELIVFTVLIAVAVGGVFLSRGQVKGLSGLAAGFGKNR